MTDLPQCPAELVSFAQGEGVGEIAGRAAERADVLAYLARKEANALLVAEKSPAHADVARAEARRFAIIAEDVRNGMHEGAAFTAAILGEDGAA